MFCLISYIFGKKNILNNLLDSSVVSSSSVVLVHSSASLEPKSSAKLQRSKVCLAAKAPDGSNNLEEIASELAE